MGAGYQPVCLQGAAAKPGAGLSCVREPPTLFNYMSIIWRPSALIADFVRIQKYVLEEKVLTNRREFW